VDAARWLTFAELAASRGISRASASKLVRRHHWRRQQDNQGRVLILVPPEALDWATDEPMDRPAVSPADKSHGISALRSELAGLRTTLDLTLALLADAQAGRDRADAQAAGERVRADQVRAQVDELRGELRRAQEAAEALRQAEIAQKAKGLLARLRDAWRAR
jgi:hypothetical protein